MTDTTWPSASEKVKLSDFLRTFRANDTEPLHIRAVPPKVVYRYSAPGGTGKLSTKLVELKSAAKMSPFVTSFLELRDKEIAMWSYGARKIGATKALRIGKLERVKVGRRTLIEEAEIERFIECCKQAA